MLKKGIKTITTVTLSMMLGTASLAGGWDVSTAHTWAQPEIEEAYAYDLMPSRLVDANLSNRITRVQFAALVVKMYETMTGEVVDEAPQDTFTDSSDTDVLKAKTLGIMKGSNGKANPDNLVTRQEMAAMYYRTLDKVYSYFGEEIKTTDNILEINDKSLVANWFTKEVDYISENNIMKGSNGNFNPLDNAGIEQAIVVAKRMYQDELDLVRGTRNIDLSKGYTYKVDRFGKDFTVTFNANSKTNKVTANDYTSLKVISNDKDNNKIYYSETHDDAIDENGVRNYSYNVATNEMTCLDDYFGYNVSNVTLIESGEYKGHILVYPFEDSVNVYSHDLELVCTLEGMVTINNANTMIHNKLHKPIANDYKQGYSINDDGRGNISVTFNNSGNTKVIVASEQGEIRSPNPIYSGRDARATKDYSKLFFIAKQNLDFVHPNSLCSYDFAKNEYKQIGEMSEDVKAYKIFQHEGFEFGQKYITELVVVDTNESNYDVYNIYGTHITNQVFVFDDEGIKTNLDTFYNNEFRIVADGRIIADSNYNLRWTYTTGKDWDIRDDYIVAQKDKGGPTLYGSVSSNLYKYQDDAVYECDMEILTDESNNGNSGIIFNVESIRPGNDNYRGYYVGIDLYKNLLIFGKSDYKWECVKEVNIGDSIKLGDRIKLKVVKKGRLIDVYIDDQLKLSIADSSYTNGGGFGFRSWNAKCRYYSITASPSE